MLPGCQMFRDSCCEKRVAGSGVFRLRITGYGEHYARLKVKGQRKKGGRRKAKGQRLKAKGQRLKAKGGRKKDQGSGLKADWVDKLTELIGFIEFVGLPVPVKSFSRLKAAPTFSPSFISPLSPPGFRLLWRKKRCP